jgi:AraC-like DNA-binding protein
LDQDLSHHALEGLERLCTGSGADEDVIAPGHGIAPGIITAPAFPGIERIEAHFAGNAFEPHRHDTYALGVTIKGVQTFSYRGERRFSMPGQVIVLHPDEEHDGGAGTDDGLQYRMLYLEPSLLLDCLEAAGIGLPFVDQPVISDPLLAETLLAALSELDRALDELFVDDFVSRVAGGLARHARTPQRPLGSIAWKRARLAREYLEAHATRSVTSGELEAVTGLDRFALARHFRAAFATSPHRYLLMRRLQQARAMIGAGEGLSGVAAATGFADQSHLTRHFKKAYGVTPGQWAALRTDGLRRAFPQGPSGGR